MMEVPNQGNGNTQKEEGKFQEIFRRSYGKERDMGDDVEGRVTDDSQISAWKTGSF